METRIEKAASNQLIRDDTKRVYVNFWRLSLTIEHLRSYHALSANLSVPLRAPVISLGETEVSKLDLSSAT